MLVKRLEKGAKLTKQEGDDNLDYLENLAQTDEDVKEADSRIDEPVSFNRVAGSWHNSPDTPYVDTIPISIITDGPDPITGEDLDSKNGHDVGVWFLTSNLAPNYSGFSNQILKSGTLIQNELCLVWLTYYQTGGIIVQNIQTFSPAYVLNIRPVITLIGAGNVNTVIDDPYVDAGATAADTEDGDISSDIVIGGDTVDINTLGAYVITFDVTDSNGASAIQVSRTVNVIASGGSPSSTNPVATMSTIPVGSVV